MAAAPRVLRVREHGRVERVQLSRDDLATLADPRARLATLARPDGWYDIVAAEVVGTLVTRGLRVVIEPKIAIRRLLLLLGFAARSPVFTTPTELDTAPDTLSAMTLVYTHALERALREGPVSTYERRSHDLPSPRGRIDVLGLVTRKFGVFPPLGCEFDEFTPDNDINRRLLAAAATLVRGGAATGPVGRHLAALCGRLADVTEVRTGKPFGPLPPLDRRFERYKPALGLAELILRHASIELHDGRTDSIGMLVDMNVLFEDFVAEGLREVLGERADRWIRHPSGVWLDEQHRLPLRPDVVWRLGSTHRLVLDVKYKVVSTPPNEDVYQMASYCQALGLRRGALVYASAREDVFVVRNGGPEIHVFMLDPDGEPDQVRERLRDLGARLSALAA